MALSLNRFSEALNRLLGARGRGAVDVPLAIIPVLPLQGGDEPDVPFTRGELRYSAHNVAGAAVANFSWVNIDNPVASGKLVVIERMVVDAAIALDFHAGVHSAGLGGLTVTTPLETRGAGAGLIGLRSSALMTTGANAAITEAQLHVASPANTSIDMDIGAVLQPGTAFRVWGGIVNTALHVTFFWTERVYALDELR